MQLYCIRYVKDTILKAIYNYGSLYSLFDKLYSICQRYNFESNLQLAIVSLLNSTHCIRYVKDTILKAIYNFDKDGRDKLPLYSICQRYNFESNLQLELIKPIIKSTVFDMSKIQF